MATEYAKYLTVLAFALISMIVIGAVFAATHGISIRAGTDVSYPSWLVLSYVAGLTMIALPCTLPLVFVVVPMTMGHGSRRGPVIAILFGAGLTITITAYMVGAGILGYTAGLDGAAQYMFMTAGVVAFVFGLSQLDLIRLSLPAYSGTPRFIQNKGDYTKGLLMGLLLGNAGVGCPNPLFYWLLVYVAGTGSAEIGAGLGVVHGFGRAVPLVLVAVLGVLGVNLARGVAARRRTIEAASGWMLIAIGSFLIINAIPGGHQWYESTIIHIGWNNLVSMLAIPPEFHVEMHTHDAPILLPSEMAPGLLAAMILGPVGWYYIRRARE